MRWPRILTAETSSESAALSGGCHFQVAGNTAFVACDGKFQVFLGCRDSDVLNLSLVFQNSQCCYVVFDLLKLQSVQFDDSWRRLDRKQQWLGLRQRGAFQRRKTVSVADETSRTREYWARRAML